MTSGFYSWIPHIIRERIPDTIGLATEKAWLSQVLRRTQIAIKYNTNNMHIVNTCQLNFAFELLSVIPKRLIKFESATDGC